MISRQRFADLAEAYGGDMARWPAAERVGAAAFVASAPDEAAAILAAARALDAWLDALPAPAGPSELLARRLLKAAPKPAAALGASAWAAMAASALIGVVVGFGGVRAWDGAATIDSAMSQAFNGDDGWGGVGQDG